MMDFDQFIQWEDTTRDTLDVKKIYIDMADDLIAGILLSQIVYWHLPSRNGGQRLRVQHDGKYWIAKARHEWWDECRISPKQFDRALDILATKGVVESHLYKFDNNPTKHIRIVKEQFMCLFEATLKDEKVNPFLPKGKKPSSSPKVKKELPEKVKTLTETTTENTTKTTATETTAEATAARPNIFRLYEGLGFTLSGLVADSLKDMEKEWPADWIEDAFKEAALSNAKSLKYVQRILETWKREGKRAVGATKPTTPPRTMSPATAEPDNAAYLTPDAFRKLKEAQS